MFKGRYYHDLPDMNKSEQLVQLLKSLIGGKQTEVDHNGKVFQVSTGISDPASGKMHTMVTELYSGKICHENRHSNTEEAMTHHQNVVDSIKRGEPHFTTPEDGGWDDDEPDVEW
jgi:hypothetical protein